MNSRGISRVVHCKGCSISTFARSLPSQQRNFTCSNASQKHVPKFSETSSTKLDGILSTFRDNVFVPAQLSTAHQKLVYGTKHKKLLEDNPVKVDLGDETVHLRHVDRTTDVPQATKGLFQAVELMKTKKDWDNLPLLLQALKNSGCRLKASSFERLVRKAGMAGRQEIILECARRGSVTDFNLKTHQLVSEVMWWIHYKAMSKDWSPKETSKALSLAEQTAVLLDYHSHSGDRSIRGNLDPRVRPEVIGILLEISAVHAKQQGGDVDGKVKTYAERLVGSMAQGRTLRDDPPAMSAPWQMNNWNLRNLLPVVYGARIAGKLLNPNTETAKKLAGIERRLSAEAQTERDALLAEKPETSNPIGLWCFDKVMGAEEA